MQRPWLQDATPGAVAAYIDLLLGPDVLGFGVKDTRGALSCKVPFHLVLEFDAQVRTKQAKLINEEGQSFGEALARASKDPELRERHFVTPVLMYTLSSQRGGNGGTTTGASSSTDYPARQQGAPDGQNKGKGRQAAKGKAKAKARNAKGNGKDNRKGGKGTNPDRITGMQSTTPEGTQICFKWNRDSCPGCERAHVCGYCLGNHPARNCPTRTAGAGR